MRLSSVLWSVSLWGVLGLIQSEERLVRTANGPVRGHKEAGDSIYTFYGIPYATAPTGPHKFKAPLPAPMWFEPLDAIEKGIVCPQANIPEAAGIEHNKVVDENCLIANVFVPETDKKKLPVVVYVHGGAYHIGFGNMALPKSLVRSKKVVAVTFNYRLGIHGFLCLGTSEAPGNAGMKDQVALLRWVNKNIVHFGGNPEDVTIAGYSAGSSAVDLLMLSPAAKGLFNKVIPESGANLSPWSIQIDPVENAKEFARSSGFTKIDDIYALEQFYTSASLDLLTSTGGFWERTDGTFLFSPCVETKTAEEPFLTDNPYNILKKGNYKKLPILYGFADMEGLVRFLSFKDWKDQMNANFSNFLPVDLKFESVEEKNTVANKIKEYYFGSKGLTDSSTLSFINLMSDILFTTPTLRAVRLHTEAGHDKIYLYEYNFVDDSTPPVPNTDNVKGANHCGQTAAVLDLELVSLNTDTKSEEMKNMESKMRELWLNFITTGKPVPSGSALPAWPATGANGLPHMSLGRTLELRDVALLEERVRFWDGIYERHYRAPQPPPTPPSRHTEL